MVCARTYPGGYHQPSWYSLHYIHLLHVVGKMIRLLHFVGLRIYITHLVEQMKIMQRISALDSTRVVLLDSIWHSPCVKAWKERQAVLYSSIRKLIHQLCQSESKSATWEIILVPAEGSWRRDRLKRGTRPWFTAEAAGEAAAEAGNHEVLYPLKAVSSSWARSWDQYNRIILYLELSYAQKPRSGCREPAQGASRPPESRDWWRSKAIVVKKPDIVRIVRHFVARPDLSCFVIVSSYFGKVW